jgi:DNA-binding CsgD family transcriptional regulator
MAVMAGHFFRSRSSSRSAFDPILDSYRAAASVDHGDWDSLRKCLSHDPVDPKQLLGLRDVLLGPLGQTEVPMPPNLEYAMFLGGYEYEFGQMGRRFRRWARMMLSFEANESMWSRPDIPLGRHFRFRRLQDSMLLAFGEVQAGRLQTAMGLAIESAHLGDENEPLRLLAPDLEGLLAIAMGDDRRPPLGFLHDLAKPSGLSPLGAWQVLVHVMSLCSLVSVDVLGACARLAERIAARLGSPRGQLVAQSWSAVAEYLDQPRIGPPELASLRAQADRSGVGLRVLPHLFAAVVSNRLQDFASALALARRAGNMWAQLSALCWICALNPNPRAARWLCTLLEVTGWRRLVLVPAEITGDSALGMVSIGLRSEAIVELASTAGRPNVLLDVATSHVEDTAASLRSRLAAVEALGTLGTLRAGELLARLSRKNDELGRRARLVSERRKRTGLSEREIEVLRLTGTGLTNREIAERLSLSQHTIARHLSNARGKLGAANRTEAAMKLEELEGISPRLS